jgi:hypothetical protein
MTHPQPPAAHVVQPGEEGSCESSGPHWHLQISESGELIATLTEIRPPLTVTAPDLATLRKRIKERLMRGML